MGLLSSSVTRTSYSLNCQHLRLLTMIERNIPVFWVTSLRYIGTILPKRYARLLKVLLPCDLLNLQTMTASFVCCIIPHGAVGKKIFTSDSVTVDLNDDIASKLMDCETLQGKPKLFFLQTCRRSGRDGGALIPAGEQVLPVFRIPK